MQGTISIIYIVILIAAFYLLIIRPQQVRNKQMRELIASLSEGDRVVTIGGLRGTVVTLKDETVVLRVLDGSELEFEKAAIAKILVDIPPLGESSNDDPGKK
ncbi:MAG: preprotein translocase subunit YajC [Actinobacteria bacterium]|nr:preprotein translocase subunit YajC [Actinomycetota bacterium]